LRGVVETVEPIGPSKILVRFRVVLPRHRNVARCVVLRDAMARSRQLNYAELCTRRTTSSAVERLYTRHRPVILSRF